METNKNLKSKGFTIVELIVVITILAILGTIGFISLQGYSKNSRDSKRVSDVQNIKKALELFSINTGKYPLPDGLGETTFSGELAWNQGIIGDGVIRNLSENISKKPLDPLIEKEYIYSTTNTQTEYQIMILVETDAFSSSLFLNKANASKGYTPKLYGNYNEVFISTDNYFIPLPSIITSLDLPLELKSSGAIESLVINDSENMPDLGVSGIETKTGSLDISINFQNKKITKDSTDYEKIEAVELIQSTFSGSSLSTKSMYQQILKVETDSEKLELANWIFGLNFGNKELGIFEIIEDIITADNPVEVEVSGSDGSVFPCELCE